MNENQLQALSAAERGSTARGYGVLAPNGYPDRRDSTRTRYASLWAEGSVPRRLIGVFRKLQWTLTSPYANHGNERRVSTINDAKRRVNELP